MTLYSKIGLVLVSVSFGAVANAQHVHSVPHTTTHFDTVRHGNHFHSVPHTTTHFDSTVHYGADYVPSYSSYPSGAVFSSGSTIVNNRPLLSPDYGVSPGYTAVSPTPLNPVNVNSLKPNALPYKGRGVTLILSVDVGGEVSYEIDGVQASEIKSGQEQLLARKGSYEIRFSRGEDEAGRDFGIARYTVTEGTYRFVVNESGWDLQRDREPDVRLVTPTENPNLKKNSLPSRSLPSVALPSTSIPSSPEPVIIP